MGNEEMIKKEELLKNMESPIILREGNYSAAELDSLKSGKIWKFKDVYNSQLTELFQITKPHLIKSTDYSDELSKYISERSMPNPELRGNYIFYPWSGLLFHMASEEVHTTLRTNRTRNLVSSDEQRRLGLFTAGVAGLSFGNGIALSLAYSGISNTIKIADHDIFETTNLNRVRVGVPSIEEAKTTITAHDIYEINPYADVKIFSDGLDENNLDEFVNGDHKLDIIFDVVDDFAMKVRLRLAAKKSKIPVIMLTSLEDSILVDVERFDLEPEAEIFHGLLGDAIEDMLTVEMSEQDKVKYAMKIVGPEHISFRNLLSLSGVGVDLVSRPHLYGTVSIVCGLAAYITKRIVLGEDMPSMRKHVMFNGVLDVLPSKDDTLEARESILQKLMGGVDR